MSHMTNRGGRGVYPGIISPRKMSGGGGGALGNPRAPTAACAPQHASQCCVQSLGQLAIESPLKSPPLYDVPKNPLFQKHLPKKREKAWTQMQTVPLHYTAHTPQFRQGNVSPPSSKTQFHAEASRTGLASRVPRTGTPSAGDSERWAGPS